jgi:hypothetical protein
VFSQLLFSREHAFDKASVGVLFLSDPHGFASFKALEGRDRAFAAL